MKVMASNNSFFTFIAGAAVGAAVALLVKSDREKINELLDKLEDAIAGPKEETAEPTPEAPVEDAEVSEPETTEA